MRVLLSFGFSFLALAPCDVPVYRYALEHWPAEPYVLVLGSGGGARDPAEAPILEALGRAVREGANLEIRREEGFGPGAVLRYPESAGIGRPVWEGRLADLVAEELVCSPLRRSVARMIEEGAAAVWILLESGAPGKDEEVARFLESHPKVAWVNYPGLSSSPSHSLAQRYLPKGCGAIVGFGIRGGRPAAARFIDGVRLLSHLANIGDAKSLVIHPASTTHQQLTEDEQRSTGVTEDFIRLSVGIEAVEDIVADIEQALEAA